MNNLKMRSFTRVFGIVACVLLIATVTIFTGRAVSVLASLAAGLIMAGYIVVEVVMLRQGISWIEGLYFGLGLAISGLATFLWMIEHHPHHLQIKHT